MSKEKAVEKNQMLDVIREEDVLPLSKTIILGIQHTFTMFGATVLVPIITGLDISVALFMAGIGTLIFHLITKGRVPAFLGSSFAFIAPIAAVAGAAGTDTFKPEMLPYAQGGIVVAGLIYLLVAGLVSVFGYEKVVRFFPPIVTGPIIMVIGLKLAPTAIGMASGNWMLAIVAFVIVAFVSIFTKGFIKLLPVICGLIGGYIVAIITGNVDFAPIGDAAILGIPKFTMAKFDFSAIMMIAPVAIATMVEHIGDVLAIGETVEKDFMKEPGLHRTLIGDGIATSISAMFGGPANTTYSENTGVLALTRVHKPLIMRVAAGFAILVGIIPKLGALISSIPVPVVGGISIILFGMIAAIGGRTLVENKVDFTQSRNLIIAAVILVLGLGGASLPVNIGDVNFAVEGMALAAIVGIILNKVLPEK
ncbi:uracil-xanthine permease [Alkaliphilus serpentinus]|uniref:Uracil-xanthine permease n=2 Tax=Alkaliphilus serpentinus TaxID=1482731 RepID=A0A833HQS2_9FIRM|nr:uracil-xanthine permease [Alkaliphilus serpentinus]